MFLWALTVWPEVVCSLSTACLLQWYTLFLLVHAVLPSLISLCCLTCCAVLCCVIWCRDLYVQVLAPRLVRAAL